jgi:hypothetical protein
MLERGTEATTIEPALPGTVITGRFARDPAHFAVTGSNCPHPDSGPPPLRAAEANVEPDVTADVAGAAR